MESKDKVLSLFEWRFDRCCWGILIVFDLIKQRVRKLFANFRSVTPIFFRRNEMREQTTTKEREMNGEMRKLTGEMRKKTGKMRKKSRAE